MPRNAVLDNAKGIAMFAVVLFHVLRGADAAGLMSYGPALRLADDIAYGFHTQTFLLVAGYLAWPRAGDGRWQLGRQVSLYHPYLLWSLVSGGLSMVLASSVNRPVTPSEFMWMPLWPIGHFWFLLALMVGTALLGLLRTQAALALGMLACAGLAFTPAAHWFGAPYHLVFVLAGGWLASRPALPGIGPVAGLAAAAVLVAGALLAERYDLAVQDIRLVWIGLAGCAACLALSELLARWRVATMLLGILARYALPIYLLHVLAGAGTRIVLMRGGIDFPAPVVTAASLLAALLLPIVAARIARQIGVDGLLGFTPLFRPAARPIPQPAG